MGDCCQKWYAIVEHVLVGEDMYECGCVRNQMEEIVPEEAFLVSISYHVATEGDSGDDTDEGPVDCLSSISMPLRRYQTETSHTETAATDTFILAASCFLCPGYLK